LVNQIAVTESFPLPERSFVQRTGGEQSIEQSVMLAQKKSLCGNLFLEIFFRARFLTARKMFCQVAELLMPRE
jgi:hypothetical protein